MSSESLPRRKFLKAAAVALAGISLNGVGAPLEPFKTICFIKPFQNLSYDQLADIVSEVGWSGVEVPLRKDGSIEPEQAERELPRLVEALAKRKIELSIIATDIEDAADPMTRRVLKVAANLGVRRYRVKHLHYDLNKSISLQVDAFRSRFAALAKLNEELGMQGTIQNHSGGKNIGGPVWDLWEMVKDLNPKHMAIYFDIGHATVEGGTSWPVQAKLVEPRLGAVSVKDFVWAKPSKAGQNWQPKWCPLGSGMVHPEFFKSLRQSGFMGPVSQHFEYELGIGKEMIAAMKRDFEELQKWTAA